MKPPCGPELDLAEVAAAADDLDKAPQKCRAVALWNEASDPRGTPAELYWRSRGLETADLARDVIRFHPACPWLGEDGETILRVPAMLAAMRNIVTDELTGAHATRLTLDGLKIGRRMRGIAAGAAIKLDSDAEVTRSLVVGEGLETTQSARQFGLRPAWAVGSVGGIAGFPVLPGVEALSLLAERERDGTPNQASEHATAECGGRWQDAGREVVVIDPPAGDLNDVLLSRIAPCAQ
jgi:hypothetical protein